MVAVKEWRKVSPPTGPISPAAKKPAAGAPASSSPTAEASWCGLENISRPRPLQANTSAPAGARPPGGAAAAERGHAHAQGLAQVAVRRVGVTGVEADDLAGVDVGGDGDLAGG